MTPATDRTLPSRPDTPTLVLLASLYCAQGLPSGLIAHALPVLLRQHSVDLAAIGLLKLLALPWMLKVLWAPWVDRIASARLGHHRGWILPLQATVILCVASLAAIDPAFLFGSQLALLLGLILVINLAAATQDIATDGLTVRLLPERWRGLGNSLQVGGYKVGMIVSGSGLLLVIDRFGWNASLGGVALLLALCTLPVGRFNEKRRIPHRQAATETALGPRLLLAHYRGLLTQPGMFAWLAVVLGFKLGDALGSPMIKPMLVDQGWSSAMLGQLTLLSSIAGIGGAALGESPLLQVRRASLALPVRPPAGARHCCDGVPRRPRREHRLGLCSGARRAGRRRHVHSRPVRRDDAALPPRTRGGRFHPAGERKHDLEGLTAAPCAHGPARVAHHGKGRRRCSQG